MEMTQLQLQPQLRLNSQLMTLYNKIKIRKLINLLAIKNNTHRMKFLSHLCQNTKENSYNKNYSIWMINKKNQQNSTQN